MSTANAVGRQLVGSLAHLGIRQWQADLPGHVAIPVQDTDFETYSNPDGDIHIEFHVREACIDRIRVHWHTEDFFRAAQARFRLQLFCRLSPSTATDRALTLFRHFVMWLRPYWGELNDEDVAGTPTFCGLAGNVFVVPRLGTFNYFDAKYVSFLGGPKRLRNAGFHTFIELERGVIVGVGDAPDNESFRKARDLIEAMLAPCFEQNIKHALPHFGSELHED